MAAVTKRRASSRKRMVMLSSSLINGGYQTTEMTYRVTSSLRSRGTKCSILNIDIMAEPLAEVRHHAVEPPASNAKREQQARILAT